MGACSICLFCFSNDLFAGFFGIGNYFSIAVFGLRAVIAVFGTEAVAYIVDNMNGHLPAVKMFAHLKGGIQQRQDFNPGVCQQAHAGVLCRLLPVNAGFC